MSSARSSASASAPSTDIVSSLVNLEGQHKALLSWVTCFKDATIEAKYKEYTYHVLIANRSGAIAIPVLITYFGLQYLVESLMEDALSAPVDGTARIVVPHCLLHAAYFVLLTFMPRYEC